jgi:cyclopropane fatty-acyl-phospholipid synthase-like methyltransferase
MVGIGPGYQENVGVTLELDRARYSAMRWNTPLSEWHADLLLEQLELTLATSVLDLGCGWGELLIRAVRVASENCVGVGVDSDDVQLSRARDLSGEREKPRQITFVHGDAQAWDQPAERVLCIGASHAWGGTLSALCALRSVVAPGGRLLFADGCWASEPAPEAVAIFGDGMLRLRDVVEHALDVGWRVLSVTTADQREWDEFESSWRRGREEWLLDNRDAPGADSLRRELDERLLEYITSYRGVLGFCYLVLTR